MKEADALRGALRAEQLRVSFARSRRAVFLDAFSIGLDIDGHGDRRGAELAFEALERLRARSLLDAVGSSRPQIQHAGTAETSTLAAEREAIVARIDRHYANAASAGLPAASDSTDEDELLALEERASELARRIATHASSAGLTSEPLTLREAESALPEGVAVLLYGIDRGSLTCIVLRRGGHEVRRAVCTLADAQRELERAAFFLRESLRCGIDSQRWTSSIERLRAMLSSMDFEVEGKTIAPTFSAGVAALPDNARNAGELLQAADGALYTSKRLGRNRVTTAGVPGAAGS